MRPDSLLRLWRYINHLLTYLLTKISEIGDCGVPAFLLVADGNEESKTATIYERHAIVEWIPRVRGWARVLRNSVFVTSLQYDVTVRIMTSVTGVWHYCRYPVRWAAARTLMLSTNKIRRQWNLSCIQKAKSTWTSAGIAPGKSKNSKCIKEYFHYGCAALRVASDSER